ncbi:MAG: sulfatase/phosphatase domain-containing protein, partial [Ginsengibacter sp.]
NVETNPLAGAFKPGVFSGRDKAFFAYLNLQRAIVKDGFKLVRYNVEGQSRIQLFDLNKDPNEMNDLGDKKQCQDKIDSMTQLLSKTMKGLNDFCDLGKPGWGYPVKWTGQEVRKLRP